MGRVGERYAGNGDLTGDAVDEDGGSPAGAIPLHVYALVPNVQPPSLANLFLLLMSRQMRVHYSAAP